MSDPVHYVTVTAPDGEVIGYVQADADGVDWISRKASSSSAYEAATEWYGKVREAGGLGLTPLGVLGHLSREPGVGPVTEAPSAAAVEELAQAVTPADDARLVAALDREDPAAWQELADAFDALTDEDRDVKWGGGQKGPSGAIQVPFPLYSQGLERVISALNRVGAVTPEHRWMDNPPVTLPPDGRLGPADAVRAATAIVRGERFCDGTIAKAVRDGLLDAVVEALRTWYAAEGGARSDHEAVASRAPSAAEAPSRPAPHAVGPDSHDTGNIITTPPQPPQPSANPYAQQPAAPQTGQPQYGMPPAAYGMSPQGGQPCGPPQQAPYGYPQQAGQPHGIPQQGHPPYGHPQQPPYGQPQQAAYGGQPHPGQEMCRFCGGRPAARVTFRAHQGFLILMRFQKYDGPMCGNCGLAVYRTLMTATLCQGWWSPFSLFIFTPFTIIWNLIARGKVSKLPHPAPGQHGQQADPGKPVHQRPLAYVALIPVLWICFLIFQGLTRS